MTTKRIVWMFGAISAAALIYQLIQNRSLLLLHHITLAAALACGFCAVLGIVYTAVSSVLVMRFFERTSANPDSFPAVTIVKPLHGAEHTLFDNLVSFCAQDYKGDVQYLFGVQDVDDPALLIVATLRERFPDARIDVIVDARLYGPNRKISNIVNMLPSARHDVLVFADSDVSVRPDYLYRVVGELQQPDVGLVTCLYRGHPDPGFWPRLSAKATNYHFLPSVVTGLALRLARPCFGQTIAIRRSTLEQIGGFTQFVHHLAEDHAIGAAVRRIGAKVAIPPFVVVHACGETSASKLFSHELRWSRTIRSINRAGHIGSTVLYPFALALLSMLLSGFSIDGWILVTSALCARLVLKMCCDRAMGHPGRDMWLLPIWDALSFGVFVVSFFSSRVVWRGFSFKVDRDGLLSPLSEQ